MTELESTHKNLKMMNSGTTKLNHILSIGKASYDRHRLGYSSECLTFKIIFVKEAPAPDPQIISCKKVVISCPQHKSKRFFY